MKTSIKKLGLAAMTLFTCFAATTTKANENVIVVNEIKNFNKMTVTGNVDVYIMQNFSPSVKVYDNYYANNALVQEKDGELRITNFEKKRLTVVVNANTLAEINASDDATINTYGKFNTISLEINLKDHAKANLNTNTLDLFAQLDDQSELTLRGNSMDYNALIGVNSIVKTDKFLVENSNVKAKSQVLANQITIKESLPDTSF